MREIKDFREIQNCISQIKKRGQGLTSNFYFDSFKFSFLLTESKFYLIEYSSAFFLLKKKVQFFNLYYFCDSLTSLSKGLQLLRRDYPQYTFISDILVKNKESELIQVFLNSDFQSYTKLIRMSKVNFANEILVKPNNINLKSAKIAHSSVIKNYLDTYFDSKAEQIPEIKELDHLIRNNTVIVYEVDSEIQGFIIYELNGLTLYLRYWFVHPNFRDLKIGSMLFKEFLYRGNSSKRQLFWVISTNYDAIEKYIHYGFKEDGLYDIVMINNNKKYA